MRKLRCYNLLKEVKETQIYIELWNVEMNRQVEAKLAFPQQEKFVSSQNLFVC